MKRSRSTTSRTTASRSPRVLMPGEYESHLLELPPLRRREIEGAIRYRLPSLYPGDIDGLLIDFASFQTKERRVVVVFLMERDDLESAGHPTSSRLVLGFPLANRLRKDHHLDAIVLASESAIELYRFDGETPIDLAAYREPSVAASALNETAALVIVTDSLGPIGGWPVGSVELTTSDAYASRGGSSHRAFVPGRRSSGKRFQSARLLVAFLAVCGLTVAVVEDRVSESKEHYLTAKNRYEDSSERRSEAEAATSRVAELEEQLADLVPAHQVDPYRFFSDLYLALGEAVEIRSVTFRDGAFQIEARGENPFELMERFDEFERFKAVRPYQIRTLPGSQIERFLISGRYIDDQT